MCALSPMICLFQNVVPTGQQTLFSSLVYEKAHITKMEKDLLNVQNFHKLVGVGLVLFVVLSVCVRV